MAMRLASARAEWGAAGSVARDRDAIAWIEGGARRQDSSRHGVLLATGDPILVHDAARPFVSRELISRLLAAVASGADAAVPGLPVSETIKRVSGRNGVETPSRDSLRAVQTPQALKATAARSAFAALTCGDRTFTDDAEVIEAAGGLVEVVVGDVRNIKATWSEDLPRARAIHADSP